MPSNFCLPPVECSPGAIPIQADSARPFPNALPLPDRTDQSRRRDRADSGNLRESLAGFIFFRSFLDDPNPSAQCVLPVAPVPV